MLEGFLYPVFYSVTKVSRPGNVLSEKYLRHVSLAASCSHRLLCPELLQPLLALLLPCPLHLPSAGVEHSCKAAFRCNFTCLSLLRTAPWVLRFVFSSSVASLFCLTATTFSLFCICTMWSPIPGCKLQKQHATWWFQSMCLCFPFGWISG